MESDFINISVYTVRQEADQNQAHSESEKRRDLFQIVLLRQIGRLEKKQRLEAVKCEHAKQLLARECLTR